MEKKEFMQKTREIFTEYGFQYRNKKYYLEMPNLWIMVEFCRFPFQDGKRMLYDIIIKKLYKSNSMETLSEVETAFKDCSDRQLFALKEISMTLNNKSTANYVPEAIELSEWKKRLPMKLHELFDPYKEDDLAHMFYMLHSAPIKLRLYAASDAVEEFLFTKA